MPRILSYGTQAQVPWDTLGGEQSAWLELPRGEPLVDPQAATRAAIRAPLGFPSLSQAIVPGDQIAVALAPRVVASAAIVAGVIQELVEAGAEPDHVTVVCTADEGNDPRRQLPAMVRGRVQLERHDPAHRDRLEFLAANRKGRPIYLNRTLCDADLLITVAQPPTGPSYHDRGLHTGLFPEFSDLDSQRRYRNPRLLGSKDPDDGQNLQRLARIEGNQVGWIAGAVFTVRCVPAGPEQLMDVLAGEPKQVEQEIQRRYAAAWRPESVAAADLVVAAISGALGAEPWSQFVAALHTASRFAAPDGTIALCAELNGAPGEGLQFVRPAVREERLLAWLDKHRPRDTLDAFLFYRLIQQYRVFLLGRGEDEQLERLGIASLTSVDELARLRFRSRSVIGIPQVQFVSGAE